MNKKISLNQRLAFIGFRISYAGKDQKLTSFDKAQIDIESTLVDASYEAMNDFRILSILMTWIKVHGEHVVVEKFFKIAGKTIASRGPNPVINGIAVFGTICKQTKWTRYIEKSKSPKALVDPELTKLSKSHHGFKEDWLKYGIEVPANMIRIREADVYSPEELARMNLQFRMRLVVGASWRADIITAIEYGVTNPTEISKLLGCSYEPARRISKEYLLAKSAA